MGHRTKVQVIKRKTSDQWYVNLPAAIAQSLGVTKGETVEWIVLDCDTLVLRRKSGSKSRKTLLKDLNDLDAVE